MQPVLRSLAIVALGVAGCSTNDFDAPSEVSGVRVLAVRPSGSLDASGNFPASGSPGDMLTLDMLYVDGRVPPPLPGEPEPPEPPEPPELELRWLGGCHNPPSRLYYGCGPVLRAIAEGVASGGLDPGALPPGIFGTESPFELPIPDDILTSAPRVATDPVHFGVSFVFFGVCTGTILPRPDRTEGVPLECVDAAGKALGARDFVVGYSTIYTYEGVTNLNPSLPSVRFDGTTVLGVGCEEPGGCVQHVPACASGDDCPEHRIAPEIAGESFERLPDGTNEILWANYYATGGEVVKESQLVADRTSGRVDDFTSKWRAPATPGTVRFWVTVNDERGGAAWATFDIVVD
jgi:hypothetical protein